MAIRNIIYANDPRLRQRARPVKLFGPALKALADDMLETLRAANGVGLAAPQIGLLQRLFVAELPPNPEDPQSGKSYVLINPQLVDSSPQEAEGVEGCLSIPIWYGWVWRPEWIVVRAKSVSGKPIRMKATGWLARVFLHEMDHLDGILFTDRVRDPAGLWQELPEEARVAQPEASEPAETAAVPALAG
jgi:peptide deformylase